ncbi:unnamed protein product [Closterium sp. NIES-65]|nr:unnamed protein product [Closterium sp. NIES-65]
MLWNLTAFREGIIRSLAPLSPLSFPYRSPLLLPSPFPSPSRFVSFRLPPSSSVIFRLPPSVLVLPISIRNAPKCSMVLGMVEHGAGSGGGQPAAYSPRQASCSWIPKGSPLTPPIPSFRPSPLLPSIFPPDAAAMVLGVVVGSGIFATPGVHGAGSGGGQRHIRHARRRAAGMVLGVVVGSGIFATPGVVLLDASGSPLLALLLWLLAGVVGYACCEVYAELGSFIPHAGGDGEYLQVAFGELASFVFMWMFFFVSTGGALSILVVTFARYAVALVRGVLVGGGAHGGWVVLVGVVFEAPQKQPRYAIALVRGVPMGGGARGGWCSWGVVLVGGVLVGGGARGGRRAKTSQNSSCGLRFSLLLLLSSHFSCQLPGAAAGGEEEMEVMVMVVGGGCVLLLTLVNCCGVEAGTWLQNLLSLSKALLIAIILSLPHLCAISTSSYQLSLSSGVEAGTWLQNLLSLSKALLITIILSLPHLCAISTSSYQLSLSSGVEAGTWLQNLLLLSKALLIAIILSLPHLCVEAGTWLQNLLSLSKALLIAIILAAAPAFMLLQGPATATANLLQPLPPLDSLDLSRLGAGLVAAIWAFDGWNCLGFLSEELKNPKRDLPRSLSIGMLIAVVICLSANVAYLCILPAQAIGISQVVAVDSVALVFGPAAGRLVALLVAFNVLGSANGTLLCNARYFYAMAREGRLPRFFGAVTKSGAPYAALCLIGGWTMVLLFFAANQLEKVRSCRYRATGAAATRTHRDLRVFPPSHCASHPQLLDYFGIATWIFYGAVAAALFKLHNPTHLPPMPTSFLSPQLLDYFGIATWIFYGAVAAALFKLRWAFPNGPRPYEARFYPLPPVIALVAAV